MTPVDTFRSMWLPRERRALLERREAGERRHAPVAVAVERRHSPRSRRSGLERRESPAGHVRNALQVLQELLGQLVLEAEQKAKLEAAVRRLWLAVAEAERHRN